MLYLSDLASSKKHGIVYRITNTSDGSVRWVNTHEVSQFCKSLAERNDYVYGIVFKSTDYEVNLRKTMVFRGDYTVTYSVISECDDFVYVGRYCTISSVELGDFTLLESSARLSKPDYIKCLLLDGFTNIRFKREQSLSRTLRQLAFDNFW